MASLDESDEGVEQTAPVWAVFGDLMSGLLGAFVLILVGVLVGNLTTTVPTILATLLVIIRY